MIYGVGVDMTEISRVEKACQKDSFLRKVFTEREAELYADKAAKLAANFAAGQL